MAKLFSASDKSVLKQVNKSESALNKFICENFVELFPKLTFIKSEFVLTGNVRTSGTNGRIDIFAYNADTKRFVIFELKKDFDKNITDQAADYRDFIEDNFAEIYLLATQTLNITLPKHSEIEKNRIEIILIAKIFSSTQIDRVNKIKENLITLIKYYWFENDLVFIDYVNNVPKEDETDTINAKKATPIIIKSVQETSTQLVKNCIENLQALIKNSTDKEEIKLMKAFIKDLSPIDVKAGKNKQALLIKIKGFITALEFANKNDKLVLLNQLEVFIIELEYTTD